MCLSTVADTDQLQLAFEPLGNPDHHVVEQGPHGAGHRPVLGIVGDLVWIDHQAIALLPDRHPWMHLELGRTLFTFEGDVLAIDGHIDPGLHDDRLLTDA